MRMGCQGHTPDALPPSKNTYKLYKGPGGPQGCQKFNSIDIFVNCIWVDTRWQQQSHSTQLHREYIGTVHKLCRTKFFLLFLWV